MPAKAKTDAADQPAAAPAATGTVSVAVAESCPYDLIRSAGRMWSRTPIDLSTDDADLDELRANPWLTVTDA